MIAEKSSIPLYSVSPMVLPRIVDKQSPNTNASVTADKVFKIGGMDSEKQLDSVTSAVAEIWSSTPSLINEGNKEEETR